MHIVTIGGSGFLGHFTARALSRGGHSNLVLTRQAARCGHLRLVPGVRLRVADVYDSDALATQFEGADAVLSMAGILNERGHGGEGFRRAHVTLPETLVTAAKVAGVNRLLHVSALGAGEGGSHYQATKALGEQVVQGSGLVTTVFRPSVIFGEGDSFFNRFAGLLRFSPVLPLACADSRLQPVWANDVASAIALALEHPDAPGSTWELAGPRVYTLGELVRWTADTLGLNRWVPGLPDGLSRLQAAMMDFVPGKPFSTDNYRSLQVDNVATDNALPRLGITPASVESVVPDILGASPRQRRLSGARRRHAD